MSVALHLRGALRDVLGPSVRAHGYRGTSPTWWKRNALGDFAVITVQASAFNSANDGRCIVNLGAAPRRWIEGAGTAPRLVSAGQIAPKAHECLWNLRLHAQSSTAPESEVWWSYRDEASALQVADSIVEALETTWYDVLDDLLTPDGIRRRAHDGDPGFIWFEDAPSEVEEFLPQDCK